ncbi:MAG TPA: hypothetical protein VNZ54_04805 [bacterium]|jgi:hypothetical protein|nr:hypothetical protein [bacterium]
MSLGYEAFVERPERSTVTSKSFIFKGCQCTVLRTVTTFAEGPYIVTRSETTISDPNTGAKPAEDRVVAPL